MPGSLFRAATTQALQATRPTYSYREHVPPPSVYYIRSTTELGDALVDFEGPYGFDCEYKALPVPGRTALVQLSNATKILLVQLSAFPAFPEKLKCILEDPSVKKIGHYTESDGAKLRDDYGILPKSLINLMPLARHIDPDFLALHPPYDARGRAQNVTLAQIVLYYLDRILPKGPVRVSNWEMNPLTSAQQEYAASDAYCAYEVYTHLMTLQEQNNPTLDPTKYTIDIEPRTTPLPKPQEGKYYIERNNPRLSKFEFDAYTLWYHGYTVPEISRTFCGMFKMERMQGYFDGEEAIISFIVTALKKDTRLPFDAIALRATINANDVSREEHGAFLEKRCYLVPEMSSNPNHSPLVEGNTEAAQAGSVIGRKRKANDANDDDENCHGFVANGSATEVVDPPREATPELSQDDNAPGTPESIKTVKRARTI